MPLVIATAFFTSYFTGRENLKLEKKKESTDDQVEILSEVLEGAVLSKVLVDYLVSVPNMETIDRFNKNASRPQLQSPTYMIYGPRGVGKRTAMQKALEKEKSVIHISLDPCTVENFYSAVLHNVNYKYDGIDSLVKKALQLIKEKGGRKPTFLIDVNDKCKPDALMHLILELKTLGFEDRLANFFTVLSTTRVSLFLPISLRELRVHIVHLEDPPNKSIQEYLSIYLSEEFPWFNNDEEKRQLINRYIEAVGTRFLDARDLMFTLDGVERKTSVALTEAVDQFLRERKHEHLRALQKFHDMFDSQLRKKIMKHLLEGTLETSEAYKATQLKTENEFKQWRISFPIQYTSIL